jgi:hypothetical protein
MRPDAPSFIILLCLPPDNFTRQGESAATQWVKLNKIFKRLLEDFTAVHACSPVLE